MIRQLDQSLDHSMADVQLAGKLWKLVDPRDDEPPTSVHWQNAYDWPTTATIFGGLAGRAMTPGRVTVLESRHWFLVSDQHGNGYRIPQGWLPTIRGPLETIAELSVRAEEPFAVFLGGTLQ